MEFMIVHFRESRRVLIDGNESGWTEETLRVDEGLHTVTLAGPSAFDPVHYRIYLSDTTEVRPQGVYFA